jgi:hypothetical protein
MFGGSGGMRLERRPPERGELGSWFVPRKVPRHPDVRIADKEDGKKHRHFNEGIHAETTVDESPRKEEHDFDIEDQEHEGDDIEPDIEPNPCVPDRVLTALICCALSRIGLVRTENPRGEQSGGGEDDAKEKEDEGLAKFRKHAANSDETVKGEKNGVKI